MWNLKTKTKTKPEKPKLLAKETGFVVTRGGGQGIGKIHEGVKRYQLPVME